MKCPKCHFENPDDTLFCGKCGTKLPSPEEVAIFRTKTLQTPVKDLIKGTTFAGRYKIIDELGRGGMGVVYKAQDTKLKRTVALKFLPPELTHISEIKERFMREAQAAAALDHPHICTVYEFDETEEKTFISMAFVEGQSLKTKIDSGPLELDEALRIATQVAEGLQEAHKKGVVHRDIKSANIMIDERGQAKIMDFGLARVAGGTLLTKEGMTMGTIAYMSPEQARGEEVNQRSDIWSLGVVFYELLTGQLPFKGEYDQTVVYSILNVPPKPITDLQADIPMALEQVVGKALEKNPDDRYQHIEELLDDLKSISEGIEPEGIRARLRKARLLRRKRAFLYAGIAGVLIIMTVIALSLFIGHAEAMDSIAVLPLANLTGDTEQEYFVDGITDELIGQLAQIGALRVISRQSVMRYKGSEKPLPEIARELTVDAVVEGTVQRVGDSVRIRVQMIEVLPEERNLWTQTYERAMTDVFVMYSDVARAIAREIRVKLTPQEETRLASARQIDPETYAAYLKGMFYLNKQTQEGIEKGLAYFHQAVEKNPADPLAYAGLALGYATIGHSAAPTPDAWPRAREAALRALKLDETLAEAHAALADVKLYYEWDWEGAEQAFQRANELNPNLAMNHYHYAWYLDLLGRLDEAIVEHKRAQELDPLTPLHTAWLGQLYLKSGQYEEAIDEARKSLELDPDFPIGYLILGNVNVKKGMYEEAIAAYQKAAAVSRDLRWRLGRTYSLAGRRDEALQILAELEEEEPTPYRALGLANLYSDLGEKDEAFRWLAYYEHPHAFFPWTVKGLASGPLRDDPRFKDLLQRLNLPELK